MNISTSMMPAAPAAGSEWWEVTPGERFIIRTSAADTGGLYTMLEIVADPRNGVPLHVHANEEEHFVVLEGSVHLTSGDQTFELSAGDSVTVKRGTPHAWGNLSDNIVRMLIVFSPGNLERTFRLIGTLKGEDLAAVLASNESDGSTVVGPPPFDNIYSVVSPRPRP
ncbi:cupin domain-containing protein [Aurantimonas aggregata]|uniref:Cupin domain-containing protein n=1 Tax=Aurantimonas aggregata TaxID=2047720 RepID=A0A6L9MG30_9HYPH|nr:cupin domain-containing protein [Aurantimonas aggregata]NDV86616.1 cupin domain-containing protein [Aurantimonas aggregata]